MVGPTLDRGDDLYDAIDAVVVLIPALTSHGWSAVSISARDSVCANADLGTTGYALDFPGRLRSDFALLLPAILALA
jgi:hypothetical protein